MQEGNCLFLEGWGSGCGDEDMVAQATAASHNGQQKLQGGLWHGWEAGACGSDPGGDLVEDVQVLIEDRHGQQHGTMAGPYPGQPLLHV